MRDELKDKAIDLLKETWAQGYEAGVQATNVDCGVVWEERIDAIKAEIENIGILSSVDIKTGETLYEGLCRYSDVLEIIDKHCGGDTDE